MARTCASTWTLGATAVDRPLRYAAGDPNAGKRPGSPPRPIPTTWPGAATTKLFNIDAAHDVLVVQDPPNDGVQVTVGPLGVDFGPLAGSRSSPMPPGQDRAYAASGVDALRDRPGQRGGPAARPIGAGDAAIVSLTAAGIR